MIYLISPIVLDSSLTSFDLNIQKIILGDFCTLTVINNYVISTSVYHTLVLSNITTFPINDLHQVVQQGEAVSELERCTMAMFVLREKGNSLQAPQETGIVIEGVEVLNELPSVTHGFVLLFSMIMLNLSFPSELRHTFKALQKIFMEIEPKKMPCRVFSLSVNL